MRRLRIFSTLIFVLLATALLLFACDSHASSRSVNITFTVEGDVYLIKEVSKSEFELPVAPAKEAYRFEGWYLDGSFEAALRAYSDLPKDKSDVTAYAKYVPRLYQFRFFTNDTAFINKSITNLSELTFPDDPVLEGYTFTGWLLNKSTPIDEDNIAALCPLPAAYDIYAQYECAHRSLGKETTVDPSCEQEGERFAKCNLCGLKIVLEILPPAGHDVVTDEAVDPTCVTVGKTQGSHCSVCHKVFVEQKELKALGHKYDEGRITVPATCTNVGEMLFECTREGCGNRYTEEIPSHKPGEWQVVIPAGCVNTGVRIKACELCGTELAREDIPAHGHDLSVVGYDESSHRQKCLLCDESFTAEHTLNGADCCESCPYYIADTPASGSVISNISKRDPISEDFENIAGVSDGTLEIVVIDIGQGDSIFIRFPDGQTMLMDSGSVNFPIGNHYDRVKKVLDQNGVLQLDYLFITHSDYDHVRYIDDVLDDYEIKNIYIPRLADDSNGNTWEKVAAAIAKEKYTDAGGAKHNAAIRYNIGDFEISGDGWRMRCHTYLSSDYPLITGSSAYSPTAPDADKDEIINSLSPVCLLEYAGRTIVLTGDSNQFNEKYLVDRGVFDGVDADVLKVGHHGSKTSTTGEFLSAVKCEYAIISYGTNVFGHPTEEVLDRLEEYDFKRIFKTKEDGNVTVSVSGNGQLIISAARSDDDDVCENLTPAMLIYHTETAVFFKRRIYSIAA